jgi:hypothetical protein
MFAVSHLGDQGVEKVWFVLGWIALIMHKLNHESIAYTKRYLGITDDELQAVAERLNL